MSVFVLTTTSASAQTWTVDPGLTVGSAVTVEAWGPGSGGSGGSTSFRSGGAGGAYATSLYILTPNDVTNGISFLLAAGSAGTAAANSTAGPDTTWSTNNLNLNPSTDISATVAGTPGTLPPNWYYGALGTLSLSVIDAGYDPTLGIPCVDIHISGTTSTTTLGLFLAGGLGTTGYATPLAASTQYAQSVYLSATNLTNVTSVTLNTDTYTAAGGFVANTLNHTITGVTSTLTRYSYAATTNASTIAWGQLNVTFNWSTGQALDFFLRIGGMQIEANSVASFFKTTPGYVRAKGGGATSGSTGGVGGATATSIGTTKFAGGSGASRTQGGGGGGSAGAAGAGASATTGTGGTANNGTVAAGASNVEGGGGATASTTPSASGAPGGGGGANTSTGSGSAGGRGQIRLTWTSPSYTFRPTRAAILAR